MGLDVYLKKFPDYEDHKRRTDEYSERSEAAYGDRRYEDLTEQEKDAIRDQNKAMAASLGLGEWGDDESVERIENDSAKYPAHMFKVGYWRSSYNSGGINHVLRDAIDKDLYYIAFGRNEHEPDEYECKLDYAAAKVRCQEVRALFADYVRDYGVRVIDIQTNMFTPRHELPVGASGALSLYRDEIDRRKAGKRSDKKDDEYDWYSTHGGEFFFGKNLEVIAAVAGVGSFDRDTIFLIYKPSADDLAYYEQALEIVEETLDFVMAQPDADKYRFSWSG